MTEISKLETIGQRPTKKPIGFVRKDGSCFLPGPGLEPIEMDPPGTWKYEDWKETH